MGNKSRKSKPKNGSGHFKGLAVLEEAAPQVSAARASKEAVALALEAFKQSPIFAALQGAKELKDRAEDIRTQVRALSREQEEAKTRLALLEREKEAQEKRADRLMGEKVTIKADAKNAFLQNPDIAVMRAEFAASQPARNIGKGAFDKMVDQFVIAGLSADERYCQLVVEGELLMKSNSKTVAAINKVSKLITRLEKRILRLSADAAMLDDKQAELQGGIYA